MQNSQNTKETEVKQQTKRWILSDGTINKADFVLLAGLASSCLLSCVCFQYAPARPSLGLSTASCGAAMVVRTTGQSVRWGASEATNWRETPRSPVRPTLSGADPSLGVWVSC